MNSKAYTEYTMGDILRLDFTFLTRDKTDEDAQAQRDSINHIIKIAEQAGASYFNWKPMQICPMPFSTNSVETDKGKLTVKVIERIKWEKENDHSDMNRFIKATPFIEVGCNSYKNFTLEDIKYKIIEGERLVERALAKWEVEVGKLSQKREELERTLELTYLPWMDHVKAVLDDGYWKFLKYKSANNEVYFYNKAPIKQRVQDPTGATEDMWEINFGHLVVRVNLGSNGLRVFKGHQNLCDDHWHPSIGSGGDVCWGDAQATEDKLFRKGTETLVDRMDTLKNILHTFSTHSPYRSLVHFKRDQDEILAGRLSYRYNSYHREDIIQALKDFESEPVNKDDLPKVYCLGDKVKVISVKQLGASFDTLGCTAEITRVLVESPMGLVYKVKILDGDESGNHWEYSCKELGDLDAEVIDDAPERCSDCDEEECMCCSICGSHSASNCYCCYECDSTEDNCSCEED